jgi:ABC-type Fe3+/spermidine/putrescine transport system ATPase subunit
MPALPSPLLRLEGLSKSFGPSIAVAPLDLAVNAGDFCAILGPSGCGKSTLLRMIAGFAEPSSGRVLIDGQDVTALGPEQRPTNMVFQGYGLFPHLSVAQNVAFGLALRKRPQAETASRVAEALKLVRLEGFDERSIDRLSGGQQQRVALARALIMRPKILLLDEPLAALDLKLRQQMQEELRRIHADIGGTFIFVTHDQGEAFALANRVVVMNAGRVEQLGTPQQVYRTPASLFVANFVGEASILRGERHNGMVTLAAGPQVASAGPDGPVSAMIRPERLQPAAEGLAATILDQQFLGETVRVTALTASGERIHVRLPDGPDAARLLTGSEAAFTFAPDAVRILDEPAS